MQLGSGIEVTERIDLIVNSYITNRRFQFVDRTSDKKPLYGLYSVMNIFIIVVSSLCSIESVSIDKLYNRSNLDSLIPSSAPNTPVEAVLDIKHLEISNYMLSKDLLLNIVNGTIINNSNDTINSAEVTVLFCDDNNTLITSSTENARFIIMAPGRDFII